MMRPMVLEFPGDRSGFDADTQYMLGDALLVAPVFTADGTVEYYVPEGQWTSLARRLRRGRPPLGRRDSTATTRCRCACARARCCPSGPSTTVPTTTGPTASRCAASSCPTASTP